MASLSSENTFDITDSVVYIKNRFQLQVQGSEAKVYKGLFLGKEAILKERFVKHYRHPVLDKTLSTERIKAEVRALCKCQELGIKCPTVLFVDATSRVIILDEITRSITVKEHLKTVFAGCEESAIEQMHPLAKKIGEAIGKMHKNELMHGDLTTSNMLLKENKLECIPSNGDFDVYFIDFGLSKRDISFEDKAVDLYVLERALLSSHTKAQPLYDIILEAYLMRMGKSAALVKEKIREVRSRGRKRSMAG